MQPLRPAAPIPIPESRIEALEQWAVDHGMDPTQVRAGLAEDLTGDWFMNDEYVVVRKDMPPKTKDWPPMVWLSIRRKDRGAARDWRHFQQIKNQLVGEECEAVELYPAESRLVDSANQYHLWCFTDPKNRLPFGFGQRLVADHSKHDTGAKQRDFGT